MAMVASAPTQWSSRTGFVGGGISISSFTPRFAIPECLTRSRRGVMPLITCRVKKLFPPNRSFVIPEEHKWMYEGMPELERAIWGQTYYPKKTDHLSINKKWYIVDATNKRLGRLASTIAYYLRGKDSPMFTPSLDMGSYVIVVNAENVGVTGRKRTQKLYWRHSGRPGGLKQETFDHLQKRIPERIIEHAVRGMLPRNRIGRAMYRKLKVFKGSEHPHTAQKPAALPIKDKRIMLNNE